MGKHLAMQCWWSCCTKTKALAHEKSMVEKFSVAWWGLLIGGCLFICGGDRAQGGLAFLSSQKTAFPNKILIRNRSFGWCFFSLLASWNLTDGPKKLKSKWSILLPTREDIAWKGSSLCQGPMHPWTTSVQQANGWRMTSSHTWARRASIRKAPRLAEYWAHGERSGNQIRICSGISRYTASRHRTWMALFWAGSSRPWARSIQWNYIKEIVSQLRFHQRWWTCPWGILQRDGQDDRSHATNWYWLFSSV